MNRRDKPIFSIARINTSVMLTEGAYLVLRNPDVRPVDSGGLPLEEKRQPEFVTLIRTVSR